MRKEIFDTVLQIAKEFPETVFCGSFGLVLNGKLDREVEDLDIIVSSDNYGFYDDYRIAGLGSNRFLVGNSDVRCFKLMFPNGVKVDCFHNIQIPDYDKIIYQGVSIKIEKPEAAINVKKEYIQCNGFKMDEEGYLKHVIDLVQIGVSRDEIISLTQSRRSDIYEDDLPF